MAENADKSTKEPAQLSVNANTFLGTQYSQVVNVSVTDLDTTFEFIFVNPRTKEGIVVSRVTMVAPAAEGFAKLILEASKQQKEKKGK